MRMARPSRLVKHAPSADGEGEGAPLALEPGDDGWALPRRRVTSDDLKSLLLASVLHVAILAAFVSSPHRLGIGGLDPDAIGVDIVTISQALNSRDGTREPGTAASALEVAENDGAEAQVVPVAPAAASRGETAPAEPSPSAAAPSLIEPKPEIAAQTTPTTSQTEAEAVDRPLRDKAEEKPPDQPIVALNQRSAGEVLASFRGASASRGREETDEVRIAMASARAGLRNEFQLEVFKAIVSRPPRHVRGVKGEVVVEFTVLRTGAIGTVRVTRSSGNPQLDASVVAAVRAAQVRPPPQAVTDDMLTFSMPFTFQ